MLSRLSPRLTTLVLFRMKDLRRLITSRRCVRRYIGFCALWRLNMAFRACLRYIHSLRRLDHSLADYARIQLLLFVYKVLHIRHPCYLFSLFRFASSARTRILVVPAHRYLAMSQSFVVLGCRARFCLRRLYLFLL
jgi:hypothetical protein